MVELPELDPLEPELEPLELPMPLLEPELGDVVLLGEVVELPLVPPLAAPAPDLLKWASHSERETCPSLLVSTDEKLGAALLALEPDVPPLEDDVSDEPVELEPEAAGEEPLELEPDAAGEDEDLSLLVLLDDELCATATLDSANKAAAVAALITLSLNIL